MSTQNTATPDQVFSLASMFATKVNSLRLSSESVQNAKDNGDHPLWLAIENSLKLPMDLIQKGWQDFYEKYFGIDEDLSSGIKIPEKKEGFDRLIIVLNVTRNEVYVACANKFPCWSYTNDLNIAVPKNDRDPMTGAYAIWVRSEVEADEGLKNLSADMLTEQKVNGITLLERMLFELKYHDETKKHLDIKNWTLCSGSRDSDGGVPYASWSDDKFWVNYGSSDDRNPSLRAREAVSL